MVKLQCNLSGLYKMCDNTYTERVNKSYKVTHTCLCFYKLPSDSELDDKRVDFTTIIFFLKAWKGGGENMTYVKI